MEKFLLQEEAYCFLCKYKLREYNFDLWFESAFNVVDKIINRNKNKKNWKTIYSSWCKIDKNKFKEEIYEFLHNLREGFKKESIFEFINNISNKYETEVGFIQKIISLLLKYIFCFYTAKVHKGIVNFDIFISDFPWIKNPNSSENLPIPIDSKVLRSLYDMGERSLGIKIYSGDYAKIGNIPWSLIDIENYKDIQNAVFKLARKNSMSPMEFEILKLWV